MPPIKERTLFISVVIIVLGIFLLATPTDTIAGATVRLSVQDAMPAGSVMHKATKQFSDDCEKLSAGGLKMKTYPVGGLVNIPEMFNAVKAGSVDIMMCANAWWGGIDPAFLVIGTYPFNLAPEEYLLWLRYFGGKALVNEVFKKYNMILIDSGAVGPEILLSKKPIHSLAEFKGVKVRSVAVSGKFFEALGATVISVPGPDIYTALERGVIDALEFGSPSLNKAFGFYEVAKYYIRPAWHAPSNDASLVMNLKKYNALPEHLKAVIQSAAGNYSANWTWSVELDGARIVEEALRTGKMKEIILPKEDVEKARAIAAKMMEQIAAKDPMAKKIYESQQAFKKIWAARSVDYMSVRP